MRKAASHYSQAIMKNIGIFIFMGFMQMLFGMHGWFPNESIYAIFDFVYLYLIPILFAYCVGENFSDNLGACLSVIGILGLLAGNYEIGTIGGIVTGTFWGILWDKFLKKWIQKVQPGTELLVRNLMVGILGVFAFFLSYRIFTPILNMVSSIFSDCIEFLILHKLLFVLSIIIEPVKVLFLNNTIHYGVLIPMGLSQVKEYGSSILFLLETNPGPGVGVLFGLFLCRKEKRKEYGLSTFIHFIGGIHEIYFPYVYQMHYLIISLILGGMTGNVIFNLLHAGVLAPIIPGSVLCIILFSQTEQMFANLLGVLCSAIVACMVTVLLLNKKNKLEHTEVKNTQKKIKKIAFICDGGIGSSVMGAALLRRKLQEKGCLEISVEAYAGDRIPEGMDLLVCQVHYLPILRSIVGDTKEIETVDSFVETKYIEELLVKIL